MTTKTPTAPELTPEEQAKFEKRKEAARKAAITRKKNLAKKKAEASSSAPEGDKVNKYRSMNVGELIDAKKALVADMALIDEVLLEVQEAFGLDKKQTVQQVPVITKGTNLPSTDDIDADIFGEANIQPGLNTAGMPQQPKIFQGNTPIVNPQNQALSQQANQHDIPLGTVTNPQLAQHNVQQMMKQGNVNPIISPVDGEVEAQNVRNNINNMVQNFQQVTTPGATEIGSTPVVPQAVEPPEVATALVQPINSNEPAVVQKLETAAPKVMPAGGVPAAESLQVAVPEININDIVAAAGEQVSQVVTPQVVSPPANVPVVAQSSIKQAMTANGATAVITNPQDVATIENDPASVEEPMADLNSPISAEALEFMNLSGANVVANSATYEVPAVEKVDASNVDGIFEAPFPAGDDDD